MKKLITCSVLLLLAGCSQTKECQCPSQTNQSSSTATTNSVSSSTISKIGESYTYTKGHSNTFNDNIGLKLTIEKVEFKDLEDYDGRTFKAAVVSLSAENTSDKFLRLHNLDLIEENGNPGKYTFIQNVNTPIIMEINPGAKIIQTDVFEVQQEGKITINYSGHSWTNK